MEYGEGARMTIGTSLSAWARLVRRGTERAIANLSQLAGQPIEVTSFGLRSVPVNDIASLVGGPDVTAVGIYLTISGSADGHLMLIFEPGTAHQFVDLIIGQPAGTTTGLGEIETSALGEMGNVVGASFLNMLADGLEIELRPSPPAVMTDLAGALLDIVVSDLMMTQDDAFIAETTFRTADHIIDGSFFVVPSAGLLRALETWEERAA